MMPSENGGLVLSGLDGSNPLGFLAAVGVLRVLSDANSCVVRLAWTRTREGWRPLLVGTGGDRYEVCEALLKVLREGATAIFDIGREGKDKKESNKFPFDAAKLIQALEAALGRASAADRRDVDLLAAFGTELYPDKRGEFQCTGFKMVRSGDANRQGMLFYAKANCERVEVRDIERALLHAWDYALPGIGKSSRDAGYSLRWDPIEDQPYALRWRDPSKSNLTDGPGTMIAANCLALEGLRCFPVVPVGKRAYTTGLQEKKRQKRFVWPIWTPLLAIDTVRSLLSLQDLHETPLRRSALNARGIEETYGVRLVRPNQYYSNFAPALPLA